METLKNMELPVIGMVTDPPVPPATGCQFMFGPVRAGLESSCPAAGIHVMVMLLPVTLAVKMVAAT